MERLRAWRVPRAFGYPGTAIAPLVDALDRAGGEPAFVPARHEETASFMATGHAKFTGGIGVCLATQGPARCNCSTVSTTPSWTASRWWRSSGRTSPARSAARTRRSG